MERKAMHYVGIDVGSTATKVAVLDGGGALARTLLCPTGFSSVDAARRVRALLDEAGIDVDTVAVVATGYGRVAVPYANKVVTEITCHGRGAARLFGRDGVVVDVGGQDTKIIALANGVVKKFVMNDKCSAGTGRFLEIMADRLAVDQDELARLARAGTPTAISSMCTVFAESEVISLVGAGEPRENIANGVIESVVARVAALAAQMPGGRTSSPAACATTSTWWSAWPRAWASRWTPAPKPASPAPWARRSARWSCGRRGASGVWMRRFPARSRSSTRPAGKPSSG